MENLKKKRGITLIALIITIVVLVILAGVTIRTISGNGGIIGNANKAAGKYNTKASEEEDILGTFANKLKEYAGENGEEPSTPDKPTPTNVEYFNWTTTESEATITGFSDLGKEKYNAGEITNLVIPSEYNGKIVTNIKDSAFSNCSRLTEVYIPKSITYAGSYLKGAFRNSNNIKKVTFEEGTERIVDFIMSECSALIEVNIPESVTTIGNSAFRKCIGITNLQIPSSVTAIEYLAFEGCTGLTKVFIPKSVTSGGHYYYRRCI